MRIDVPADAVPSRPERARSPLVNLGVAFALLVCGAAVPLLAADTLDRLMIERGWRAGEPRLPALRESIDGLLRPSPALPELRFDVRFRSYSKLLARRIAALRSGILRVDNTDFIPASLRFEGRTMAVRVRLQGDDVRALRGDRWPLRVRVRGGEHVLGIERFTLRPPRYDGLYAKRAICRALRAGPDLLVPRYRFVRVWINGKPLGAMALEEYLSKELVAASGRAPGPLLRIEDASVLPAAATRTFPEAQIAPMADLRGARAEVVRPGRWRKTPARRRLAERGRALLDDLLRGVGRPSDQVDVVSSAALLAGAEYLGAPQLLRWDNLRWYYNPGLERLEPVAYIADPIALDARIGVARASAFGQRLLGDPQILRAFTALEAPDLTAAAGHELRGDYPMAVDRNGVARGRIKRVRKAIRAAVELPPLALPRALTATFGESSVGGTPSAPRLTIGPGRYRVEAPLRVPAGVAVVLRAGARLRFGPHGSLTVAGDLTVRGTRSEPVRIHLDRAIDPLLARGLRCIRCSAVIAHLEIEGPEPGVVGRPPLSSFGGRLELSDLRVRSSAGVAAIELVHSRVRAQRIEIHGSRGDGLALIHCNRVVARDLQVQACADDGIDIRSGSELHLAGVRIRHSGDKALSIGEGARVRVDDLAIEGAVVGLAAKDGSRVSVHAVGLAGISGTGLAAFAKKIRYGAASLVVTGLVWRSGGRRALAHGSSSIRIDGASVPPVAGSIERLYELGMLGAR